MISYPFRRSLLNLSFLLLTRKSEPINQTQPNLTIKINNPNPSNLNLKMIQTQNDLNQKQRNPEMPGT